MYQEPLTVLRYEEFKNNEREYPSSPIDTKWIIINCIYFSNTLQWDFWLSTCFFYFILSVLCFCHAHYTDKKDKSAAVKNIVLNN